MKAYNRPDDLSEYVIPIDDITKEFDDVLLGE